MKEAAYQKYLDSYLEICPQLEAKELAFIRKNLSLTTFSKKAFYLKIGQVQKEMGFVYQGLLSSYYIDDQGKKITSLC